MNITAVNPSNAIPQLARSIERHEDWHPLLNLLESLFSAKLAGEIWEEAYALANTPGEWVGECKFVDTETPS